MSEDQLAQPGNPRVMMASCPRCGAPQPSGSNFCNLCGAALAPPDAPESSGVTLVGGERRQATVLFADLSGFTPLCERLDPEEVRELMGGVFSEAARIVIGYGGVVEKYIGDAVMAVFGANRAHEDDSLRAARTAREFRQHVLALRSRYSGLQGVELDVHSGINSGVIVTGQISSQAGAVGVVGDTVNLAARLSDMAEAGQILLGPETAVQLERFFEVEPLGVLSVKGKAQTVRAFRLGEPRERPSATRRLAGVHAGLVGREVESALLKRSLDRLRDGRGSILALRGEAGMGKSRLVEEFRHSLPPDWRWLTGIAYDHTRGIPYHPVIDMLNRAWGIQDSDTPEAVRSTFEARCRELLDEPDEHIPFLGMLYALEYPQTASAAPEYRQQRLERGLLSLFEGMARQGPTVFFLEDMHWADPSTVSLVRQVLTHFTVPSIVLCAYRPPFRLMASDQEANGYREIELELLSAPQVADLVAALLPGGVAPSELLRFVQARASGNPFFVEELLNALIDLKVLLRTDEGWQLTGALDRVDLPTTVQGVIAARLDHLDPQDRRVLQEASVIGQRFFYEVLRRISRSSEELLPRLRELQVQDLVRAESMAPDLEYLFKHPLTQEVVYRSLLLRERRQIHERVGQAIEAVLADRLPEYYERLAFHFLHGASRLKAADYLVKAGRKAVARFALEEADAYFQRGLELLRSDRVGSDEERILIFELLHEWGKLHYYRAGFRSYLALLDPLADEAEKLGDPAMKGMYHAWRGAALYFLSRLPESEVALRRALALAEESGDPRTIAYACVWLASTCASAAKFEEGIQLSSRAHELALKMPDDDYLGFKSLAMIAYNCWEGGEVARLFHYARQVLELAERLSNPRGLLMGNWALALAHLANGEPALALQRANTAVGCSKDPFYVQVARFAQATARVVNGLPDPGFEQVIATMEAECDYLPQYAKATLGLLWFAEGRMAEGLELMRGSARWFESMGDAYHYHRVRQMTGMLYLRMATGPRPSAATLLRNAGFVARHAPLAARRAESLLSEAADYFGSVRARAYRAQALHGLGTLCLHKRRTADAQRFLSEAADLFGQLGATGFLQQVRTALARTGA